MYPKFNAISAGRLRPHIVHAFLQRFRLTAEEVSKLYSMTTKNGKEYIIYRDFAALPTATEYEFIGSFQEWMDGRRFVIIRPFNPAKLKPQPTAAKQPAEGTEQ